IKTLPKLDDEWILGTVKDRLCVFRFPNTNSKEKDKIEIWVMRNDQVSWEGKLLPPGYDTNKTTMDYIPHRNILSGYVHIWLLEEGSGAPVLVRSIDHPHNEQICPSHDHIRLSTYSECNYNYNEHVFVKSLVSPHGYPLLLPSTLLLSLLFFRFALLSRWSWEEHEEKKERIDRITSRFVWSIGLILICFLLFLYCT
nr:hypothetical protein [Tanacetum cinerariifolium]